MLVQAKTAVRRLLRKTGYDVVRWDHPALSFHSDFYRRHTARRLEHLASLRIPVGGMSVLEVGAGVGDHSHYYIDRGCRITITEVRPEHLAHLRRCYPDQDIQQLDMEHPVPLAGAPFDVIHCYGLLYHLSDPAPALEYLSANCRRMLFLETCVSFGEEKAINPIPENAASPIQAYSGGACRPTRPWVFEKLRELFQYVYVPKTQPAHPEFPLDWTAPEKHTASFSRAVFIASRERIDDDILVTSLPRHQALEA